MDTVKTQIARDKILQRVGTIGYYLGGKFKIALTKAPTQKQIWPGVNKEKQSGSPPPYREKERCWEGPSLTTLNRRESGI